MERAALKKHLRERPLYHPLTREQAEAAGINVQKIEAERPVDERVNFASDVLEAVRSGSRTSFWEKAKNAMGLAWRGEYQYSLQEGLLKKQGSERILFLLKRIPEMALLDLTGAGSKTEISNIITDTKQLINTIRENGIQTIGKKELSTIARNMVKGAWMAYIPFQYTLSTIGYTIGREIHRQLSPAMVELYENRIQLAEQRATQEHDDLEIDVGEEYEAQESERIAAVG